MCQLKRFKEGRYVFQTSAIDWAVCLYLSGGEDDDDDDVFGGEDGGKSLDEVGDEDGAVHVINLHHHHVPRGVGDCDA